MSEALVSPRPDTVEYPTRDGRPVAETDLHYLRSGRCRVWLAQVLRRSRRCLRGFESDGLRPARQSSRRHLSPDIFVAFGVRSGSRDLFKIWEEKPPSFVLEITSKTTRREDERTKRKRYAQWGVPEYFLYDPRAEWVKPPLQGFRLQGRRYRRMSECVLPNGKRGLECKTLQLYLWLRDGELRLYEPSGGRDLPTPEEEGTPVLSPKRDWMPSLAVRSPPRRERGKMCRPCWCGMPSEGSGRVRRRARRIAATRLIGNMSPRLADLRVAGGNG